MRQPTSCLRPRCARPGQRALGGRRRSGPAAVGCCSGSQPTGRAERACCSGSQPTGRAERARTCTFCTRAAACAEHRYCETALFRGLNPPENAPPPSVRVPGQVCCKRPGINCVPSSELLETSTSNTQPERLTGLHWANQGQNTAGYNDYVFLRNSTRNKISCK